MPEPDNSRITLAVLKNDLVHLCASVEAMRADMLKVALETGAARKDYDLQIKNLDVELKRLQTRMAIVQWAGGVVTTILVALVIGLLSKFFGL
jgi:hypothetical protein